MLRQSCQVPPGVFHTNSHQNLSGSSAAGQEWMLKNASHVFCRRLEIQHLICYIFISN